jgi:hypothetical protein
MPVHYALYDDAGRYDSYAATPMPPTLVFQGTRDESVDPASVAHFAHDRPNVRLRWLDDDHQLLGSLETIWSETETFLGLRPGN